MEVQFFYGLYNTFKGKAILGCCFFLQKWGLWLERVWKVVA